MSLSAVQGPLSREPGGSFNFRLNPPGVALYLDPMPYRIRAIFEGETVVDSRRPYLLHEGARLPVYYFDAGDMRLDLLDAARTPESGATTLSDEHRRTALFAGTCLTLGGPGPHSLSQSSDRRATSGPRDVVNRDYVTVPWAAQAMDG